MTTHQASSPTRGAPWIVLFRLILDRKLMTTLLLLLHRDLFSLYVSPRRPFTIANKTVLCCIATSSLFPPSSNLPHILPVNHHIRPWRSNRLCSFLDWRCPSCSCASTTRHFIHRRPRLGLGHWQLHHCTMAVQPFTCRSAEQWGCEEGERQLVLRLHRLPAWY